MNRRVLLPYRFTLFSNIMFDDFNGGEFYYLIDLHYSQTRLHQRLIMIMFYYLIDLHYSQTYNCKKRLTAVFYYLIDLHYSQTIQSMFHHNDSFTTL